ncbi:MAG: hypothetical protein ACRC10_01250 [Thermoguttaceae bacterium]
MSPFRNLFWKEYRQYRFLTLSILLACIGCQLAACLLTRSSDWNLYQIHLTYDIGWCLVYFGTLTSIIFSKEKEDKTFFVLRYAPIRSIDVFKAKMTWLFLSTFIILCFGSISPIIIAARSWDLSFPPFFHVIAVSTLGLLLCFSWGIFSSVVFQKQIASLLSTIIGIITTGWLAPILYEFVFPIPNPFPQYEVSPFLLFALYQILIVLPFGLIGLYKALHWLDRDIVPRFHLSLTDDRASAVNRAVPQPVLKRPAKPFLALIWLAYAQSRTLIRCSLLIPITAVFFCSAYNTALKKNMGISEVFSSIVNLSMYCSFIIAAIFCASTFAGDNRNNQIAVLAQRGIRPGKIWFSRILLFGGIYLVYYLFCILCTLIVNGFGKLEINHGTFRILFCGPLLFPFCFGQLCSIFSRSFIKALGGFIFGLTLFYMYCGIMTSVLDCSPIWTVLPILLGCLVASRLHCPDWLKGQTLFQARKAVWLSLLLPPLLILFVATPLVRCYSVPKVYLGYRHFQGLDPGPVYLDDDEQILDVLKDPNRSMKEYDLAWTRGQILWKHSIFGVRPFRYEDYHHQHLSPKSDATPEELRDHLQFLLTMPQNMAPLCDVVARINAQQRDILAYAPQPDKKGSHSTFHAYFRLPWIDMIRLIPWEKARLSQRLENMFQLASKQGDQIDQQLFGPFHGRAAYDFLEQELDESDRDEYGNVRRDDSLDTMLDSFTRQPFEDIRPYKVYERETNRQAAILETALQLWYLEHGELPESLEQLKGTYLDTLPLVPYTKLPFRLVRKEPGKDGSPSPYLSALISWTPDHKTYTLGFMPVSVTVEEGDKEDEEQKEE